MARERSKASGLEYWSGGRVVNEWSTSLRQSQTHCTLSEMNHKRDVTASLAANLSLEKLFRKLRKFEIQS